mgnify:CR=1 FL=1
MPWPEASRVTWQEQVRTISTVVSALCLVAITIAIVSAGVYTVHVVTSLETNHNNLGSMMSDGKEALQSANHFLQGSQMNPLLQDFHNLIEVMAQLAKSIEQIEIQKVLGESEAWRNMSSHAMVKIARSILEL